MSDFAAGGLAGCVEALFVHPLDMVSRRLQPHDPRCLPVPSQSQVPVAAVITSRLYCLCMHVLSLWWRESTSIEPNVTRTCTDPRRRSRRATS